MRQWTAGYTQTELDAAQERFGLRFPPDLVALLRERRPLHGYDWRTGDERINRALAHPLDGLLFDVEENALWWSEWGERPATPAQRAEILTAVVKAAPRLIPIIGHRYIPQEPHAAGNPVFSIMQSDVIYYGADLADFFEREFFPQPFPGVPMRADIRWIPFWSDLVERNHMARMKGPAGG
ncbi:MAG TPA: hypothetical protein VMS43_07260 [Allosphingosinicella sp.]|nr:hypothetical protein [Allosphingosinicella sp.]